MCVCDDKNIGDAVILKSAEQPCFHNAAMFLDLAISRTDRWKAELQAWTTLGGARAPLEGVRAPLLIARKPINYCPMCGRRLSLGDAGREDT